MNQQREDFEQLRRLLKLKRYEQPPPRYFNDFSSQVLARIRKGERGELVSPGLTWYERFWGLLHARPAYSGLFGATICAALIGVTNFVGGTGGAVAGVTTLPNSTGTTLAENEGGVPFMGSTNPVPALGSIFDQIAATRTIPIQRAGFHP